MDKEIASDIEVVRNQHGQIVSQRSICSVDGQIIRTSELRIYEPPTNCGYWLQMVGGLAIVFIGLWIFWNAAQNVARNENQQSFIYVEVRNA